jgi:phage terminase large subunit-like protein
MNNLHPALHYCQDVLSGKIVTGKYVKLAIQRHLDDLKTGPARGLYFDAKAAQRVIDFFHLLRHHKGEWAGRPVVLEPWQQFYIWCLYGWKRTDGSRRFRKSYLEVARKNGKTTLSAGKALYALIADSEPGAQVYTVATKEDQARIAFDDAAFIIDKTPSLKKVVKTFTKSITYQENSFVKPLGSDSKRQDGFDPSYAIIDEYHAHPDASMLGVIQSGMGARRQPLTDIITTAGPNIVGPCYKLRKVVMEILEGKKNDDAQFGMIFCLDIYGDAETDDNWEDKKNWVKANPNVGISPKWEFLEGEYTAAKNEGGETEVNFKCKNLNIWTKAAKIWIQDEKWMACQQDIKWEALKGAECFGGIDLASSSDITSLCLLFPRPDGEFFIKLFYWLPEETARIRSKQDGVPYEQWVQEKLVSATEGNVTDYNYIKETLRHLSFDYKIRSIAYDQWNSSQLVNDLVAEGFTMSKFSQGFVNMSAPTKEFAKLIRRIKLKHDGDPVMRWMMGNVSIRYQSIGTAAVAANNEDDYLIRIDKAKCSEKVDGPVAAVMALGEYLSDDSEGDSIYESRGIISI